MVSLHVQCSARTTERPILSLGLFSQLGLFRVYCFIKKERGENLCAASAVKAATVFSNAQMRKEMFLACFVLKASFISFLIFSTAVLHGKQKLFWSYRKNPVTHSFFCWTPALLLFLFLVGWKTQFEFGARKLGRMTKSRIPGDESPRLIPTLLIILACFKLHCL